MVASGTSKAIDGFFNLGNKATRGDPVRKALYDYCLYWIVFSAFVYLTLYYIISYFFRDAAFSSFVWGLVVGVFSWFNYWALISFRATYQNMKKFYSKPLEKTKEEDFEELFNDEVKNKKNKPRNSV